MTFRDILKKRSYEKGFSLISVMMGVVLSSVVALGMANLITMMTKAQSTVHLENDIVQMMEDVKRSLIRSNACLISISTSGQVLTKPLKLPVELNTVYDENRRTIVSLGKRPEQSLNVRSIKIDLEPSYTWAPNQLLNAELSIIVSRDSSSGYSKVWNRKIPLTLETGPGGELLGCNAISIVKRADYEKSLCKTLKGELKPNMICDLSKSLTLTEAVCASLGLRSKGQYCE